LHPAVGRTTLSAQTLCFFLMRVFIRPLAPLLLCAALLSGCYSVRLSSQAQSATDIGPAQSRRVVSLFWGLLNKPQVVTTPACDSLGLAGVSEVYVRTSFGGALLTVATLGIYHPQRMEWKCAKPCRQTEEL